MYTIIEKEKLSSQQELEFLCCPHGKIPYKKFDFDH